MLPVEAVPLLGDDVCYTEEVPVRIRWVIADLGGHTVDDTEVLVTTDLDNEVVDERLSKGESLVKAPSLLVHMEPDRELEAGGDSDAAGVPAASAADEVGASDRSVAGVGETTGPDYSGGGIVDGEIVGTDDHTAAVAGVRRTSRTEVPSSVMDEIEDAVALMTRSMRQGEWEQSQTHASLLAYLREETEELAEVIATADGDETTIDQQELCKELSDILLQVLFHAEIANRRGSFDIGHVAGAFVAKLRSRAPYLFEEVERPVGLDEQNRLWAEGRVKEGKPAYKETTATSAPAAGAATGAAAGAGAHAATDVSAEGAEGTGVAGETSRVEPHASEFTAVDGSVTGNAAGTAGAAGAGAAAPSVLVAAEEVIVLARKHGLHDSEIPTDIRFPMLGLERDIPGDADNRLIGAVDAFRRELEFRFGPPPEDDDVTEVANVAAPAESTDQADPADPVDSVDPADSVNEASPTDTDDPADTVGTDGLADTYVPADAAGSDGATDIPDPSDDPDSADTWGK